MPQNLHYNENVTFLKVLVNVLLIAKSAGYVQIDINHGSLATASILISDLYSFPKEAFTYYTRFPQIKAIIAAHSS